MGLLKEKVAFITGASSGIGEAIARRFAAEGSRVVLADIDAEAGQLLCTSLEAQGHQALFVSCDVSQPAAVQTAIEAGVSRFGRLDAVCANAGINGVWAPIDEIRPEEWDHTLGVNLKGTFLTVHYALPHLKAGGGGSIIITSSVNGNRTFSSAGASAYSTSKAGQVAFMKMTALEVGRHNIRCNAICPGYIPTQIDDSTQPRSLEKIEIDIEFPKGLPGLHGGVGQPNDAADVCVFLASDMSRHVSGVDIYVDGGASLLR